MNYCSSNKTGHPTYMTHFVTPWSASFIIHVAVFTIFSLSQAEFKDFGKRQSANEMTLKLLIVNEDLVSKMAGQKMPDAKQLDDNKQEISEIGKVKQEDLFIKVADTSELLPLEDPSAENSNLPSLKEKLILNEGKESFDDVSIKIHNKKSQDIYSKTASQASDINRSGLENAEPVLLKENKLAASTLLQQVLTELNDGDYVHDDTFHAYSRKSSLAADLSNPAPKNIDSTFYSKTKFNPSEQPTSFGNKDPLVTQEVLFSTRPRKMKLRKEKSHEVLNSLEERSVVKETDRNKVTSLTREVKFDTKKLLDRLVPNALPKKAEVSLSIPIRGKKINQSSQLQPTKRCEGLSESTSNNQVKTFYAEMNAESVRVSQLLGNKFQPFVDARMNITYLLGGTTERPGYGQNRSGQITISYLLMQRQLIQVNSIPCKN